MGRIEAGLGIRRVAAGTCHMGNAKAAADSCAAVAEDVVGKTKAGLGVDGLLDHKARGITGVGTEHHAIEDVARVGHERADQGLRDHLPVDWVAADSIAVGIPSSLKKQRCVGGVVALQSETGALAVKDAPRRVPRKAHAVIQRQAAG